MIMTKDIKIYNYDTSNILKTLKDFFFTQFTMMMMMMMMIYIESHLVV